MGLICVFILIFSMLLLIIGLWSKNRLIFTIGVCLFLLSAAPAIYELDSASTNIFSSVEKKLEQFKNV